MSEVDRSNQAIWVNGAKMSYGWGSWESNSPFADLKREALEELRDRTVLVNELIKRHHKKKIKGREYWYLWEDGKWISRGSVEKGDPRETFFKELSTLKKKIDKLEKNIATTIIKKYGDHLVMDLKLFRKFLTRDLPNDLIPVRKILGGKV